MRSRSDRREKRHMSATACQGTLARSHASDECVSDQPATRAGSTSRMGGLATTERKTANHHPLNSLRRCKSAFCMSAIAVCICDKRLGRNTLMARHLRFRGEERIPGNQQQLHARRSACVVCVALALNGIEPCMQHMTPQSTINVNYVFTRCDTAVHRRSRRLTQDLLPCKI
jgi:hypothetical protein